MRIERFGDILAWQKSRELSISVYKQFSKSRYFGFRDQIQRASVSIMNNIAEGFERKSNKDFIWFLYVAKGSCGEVRSMLILAIALNKIDTFYGNELKSKAEEISKMISGFIKYL